MIEGEMLLVVNAIRQASKFLLRDYFELENLQTSKQNTINFSQKSCTRILQTLQKNLSKYYKTILFDSNELISTNFIGKAVLIETMDGFVNFTRSSPLFSIMVTIVSRKGDELIAEKTVMQFPALGEIYYTEKGKNAWLERDNLNIPGATRLRVSQIDNMEGAIASTSIKLLDLAKSFQNLRVFESATYSLAQLIAGKLDVIIIQPTNMSLFGMQLFIESAAGMYQMNNNVMIASNQKIHDKIKHITN
ncbi:MAG: hypothetical protein AB8B66_01350 [Rickettsiaceae bacterium]